MSDSQLVPLTTYEINQEHACQLSIPAQDTVVKLLFIVRHDPAHNLPQLLANATAPLAEDVWRQAFAASKDDMRMVEKFVVDQGMTITDANMAGAYIRVETTVGVVEQVFKTTVAYFNVDGLYTLGTKTTLSIPDGLQPALKTIYGFESFPRLCRQPLKQTTEVAQSSDSAVSNSQTKAADTFSDAMRPQQLAEYYQFPQYNQNAQPQSIGIIAMGGGCWKSDLHSYFKGVLWRDKVPNVSVTIGESSDDYFGNPPSLENIAQAASLQPVIPSSESASAYASVEMTMDIELVGAFCPDAHIQLYIDNDSGIQAIATLYWILIQILFQQNERPTVVSMSFAFPELRQELLMEPLMALLANQGITLCAASGDFGTEMKKQAYPAISPYVLACGGTHIKDLSQSSSEVVWQERFGKNVWGVSAGGESKLFDLPTWQRGLLLSSGLNGCIKQELTGRGIPDVSAAAQQSNGVALWVGAQPYKSGGTSGATPITAALVATINSHLVESVGRTCGHLTETLYRFSTVNRTYKDIVYGNNHNPPSNTEDYQASRGWDGCTGWGSPNGEALLQALTALYTQ